MIDLRSALKERGMTIAELCRRSGIPRRTIEDIIRRGSCMFSTAQRIAFALQCDLTDLQRKEDRLNHDGR